MELKVYKALWGMTGTLDEQLDRIAEAGYDGIETPIPSENLSEFTQKVAARDLGFIGMLFVSEPQGLEAGLQLAAEADVNFVNIHSGKDSMTFDEGCTYFEAALNAEQKSGLRVVHETHRGRILYNPWVTASYLQKFPELKLAADFSHWTCVCESMLWDQEDALALAAQHTYHIHGRVGYEQGPQVTDPRAPEFAAYVERFETWWDNIRKAHEARGETTLYFDPEFGPPGYLHTLPYTQQPVADLWDVCLYMANRTRQRWA